MRKEGRKEGKHESLTYLKRGYGNLLMISVAGLSSNPKIVPQFMLLYGFSTDKTAKGFNATSTIVPLKRRTVEKSGGII